MNQSDLIAAVSESTDLTKADVKKVLDGIKSGIISCVASGGKITLPDLGTFDEKVSQPRTGRNPRTGDELQIEGYKSVKFKPSKNLKRPL